MCASHRSAPSTAVVDGHAGPHRHDRLTLADLAGWYHQPRHTAIKAEPAVGWGIGADLHGVLGQQYSIMTVVELMALLCRLPMGRTVYVQSQDGSYIEPQDVRLHVGVKSEPTAVVVITPFAVPED